MTNYFKIFLLASICLVAFCRCAKEPSQVLLETKETKPHLITQESALSSLQDFLNEAYSGEETKALSNRTISTISTICCSSFLTKSSAAIDADEILYLVNFEDEQGYAILAADDRISDDVLIVTERGSLSESTLKRILRGSGSEGTGGVLYPGYPSTGDGIYTDDNYPGYSFLNPNTFNPYDSDLDDTYVVDLNVNVIDSTFVEKPGDPISNLGGFVHRDLDSAPTVGDEEITCKLISSNNYVSSSVSPLLTFCKSWTQDEPFNDLCPIVYSKIDSAYVHADAGCVPLAVAKIMTYFEYPAVFSFNGNTINWTALKSNYNSSTGKISAALLVRAIGVNCISLYFGAGTFTFPKKAKQFLGNMLYSNVQYGSYSTDKVISALDDGCPVFVCSLPRKGKLNFDFGSSHAWNIDGYYTRTNESVYEYYRDRVYWKTTTVRTSKTKVHCDFGWGGKANGYYTSGLFDQTSQSVELDKGVERGNHNYNYYLKTITYENPL